MKLKSVRIEKFKRIDDITLELGRVNILVGANSSGKSSVLQALHLASCLTRQAANPPKNTTSTVSVTEIDYLPTADYAFLGHKAAWGNKQNTPSSKVTFNFQDDAGSSSRAHCVLRAARNAGISISGSCDSSLYSQMRRSSFFSAYIPGLSGIPNTEAKSTKRVVLKACSYGDSNVYLRNALDILTDQNRRLLEQWFEELTGITMRMRILHSAERDLVIRSSVEIANHQIPLELLGTGHLQLIQIFCYILMYGPKILLIDEPDIHLHPHLQERLVRILNKIADERGMCVLLSTHSPFIVRGATLDTNVYWLSGGKLKNSNREHIEMQLGWGGFGKKVLIVSEDGNISMLREIIAQWPDIDRQVAYYPRNGYNTLPKPEEAKNLQQSLGGRMKILIHRDRDALTDKEAALFENNYADKDIRVWITEGWDIESYFCSAKNLASLRKITESDAQKEIEGLIEKHISDFKSGFDSCRAAANQEFYKNEGGSPVSDEIWQEFREQKPTRVKGKTLMKKLKDHTKIEGRTLIGNALDGNLSNDLRSKLQSLLG